MITAVPVALLGSGRYAVSVGMVTLNSTVPVPGTFTEYSLYVHFSDPGAGPGQSFNVCA